MRFYVQISIIAIAFILLIGCSDNSTSSSDGGGSSTPLSSQITDVQPMTGMVLWETSGNKNTDAIQLEFSYLRYDQVINQQGVYNWSTVDGKLNSAASRSHQIILRFWETMPGEETTIPDYIKALPDYNEIVDDSEGSSTSFPDWSHPEYQRFILEFYEKFAERYDNDPRLAFLEVGFGLWAEYHIYDPGEIPGTNFPSFDFQANFFHHLDSIFQVTPWMISQDAHDASNTPFSTQSSLLDIKFGIFDDSFHLAWPRSGYNYSGWQFFGLNRYSESPMGGEILFGTQSHSDYVDGEWAAQADEFGITFMITEQWLSFITTDRLKDHSMACGYKFTVNNFEVKNDSSFLTVENTGVAPIYYDAFITVNGVRSNESLKYLQPGRSHEYIITSGGSSPEVTIESDYILSSQEIQYEADIK